MEYEQAMYLILSFILLAVFAILITSIVTTVYTAKTANNQS